LSPSSRMGLASISWNSVRVFSKSRKGLFRVLYHGTGFGTAGVSLKHIVLCPRRFGNINLIGAVIKFQPVPLHSYHFKR
jgi:hypothetical protein